MARVDLQRRMGIDRMDFELVRHTSSRITNEGGGEVTTKTLKVRADYNSCQVTFMSLLECLERER